MLAGYLTYLLTFSFWELSPSRRRGLFLPGGFCLSGQACYGCSFPLRVYLSSLVFLNASAGLLAIARPSMEPSSYTIHESWYYNSFNLEGSCWL
jgi:hypothetical protein